jgi:hypothetical protein
VKLQLDEKDQQIDYLMAKVASISESEAAKAKKLQDFDAIL